MKRLLGKLISTIVIGGAVAAGVAYALEKMEYKKDLKESFDEFDNDLEDEDFSDVEIHTAAHASETVPASSPASDATKDEDIFVDEGAVEPEGKNGTSRAASANYVSLNTNKEKFTEAAKNTFDAAKVLAGAAIDMAKDMSGIVKEESGTLSGDMSAKLGQAAATVKEETGKIVHRFTQSGSETGYVSPSPAGTGSDSNSQPEAAGQADCASAADEPDAPTITISEE